MKAHPHRPIRERKERGRLPIVREALVHVLPALMKDEIRARWHPCPAPGRPDSTPPLRRCRPAPARSLGRGQALARRTPILGRAQPPWGYRATADGSGSWHGPNNPCCTMDPLRVRTEKRDPPPYRPCGAGAPSRVLSPKRQPRYTILGDRPCRVPGCRKGIAGRSENTPANAARAIRVPINRILNSKKWTRAV